MHIMEPGEMTEIKGLCTENNIWLNLWRVFILKIRDVKQKGEKLSRYMGTWKSFIQVFSFASN